MANLDRLRALLRLPHLDSAEVDADELRAMLGAVDEQAQLRAKVRPVVAEVLDQIDLYLEGHRDPLLYLGPILVALLDQFPAGALPPEQAEHLGRTRKLFLDAMIRRAPEGRPAVERWVAGIGKDMRGEGA